MPPYPKQSEERSGASLSENANTANTVIGMTRTSWTERVPSFRSKQSADSEVSSRLSQESPDSLLETARAASLRV